MKKKFNVTGLCYPHQHYMMDVTQKRAQALAMVEEGDYFIINRPRQYGKTTMLYLLGIEDVEIAVQEILRKDNTNFESLIKNIENNDTLYNLVYRVLIEGEKVPFNPHEVLIGVGRMYGIFKMNGHLKIHNKIYEQILYNYLTAKTIISLPKGNNYSEHFLLENRALDMPAILRKFQQFMKEQYSKKQIQFLEEQGRLIFLSFFTPILNGQGYAFREVQISLEKRLDIVVTYLQFRYIIELKKWYGPKAHQAGLDQLADYLDIHGVSKGYLVIFDARKKKDWNEQAIRHKGKDIFMVWV